MATPTAMPMLTLVVFFAGSIIGFASYWSKPMVNEGWGCGSNFGAEGRHPSRRSVSIPPPFMVPRSFGHLDAGFPTSPCLQSPFPDLICCSQLQPIRDGLPATCRSPVRNATGRSNPGAGSSAFAAG
jgi:hypothetical protein